MNTSQVVTDQLIDASSALLPDGPLRDSITGEIAAHETGVVVTLGSDLPYASVIDQGFIGTEQVCQSLRLQSIVFGRPMTPRDVLVRAHMRQVDIPARDFLSGPLDAMQDDIGAAYADAVGQALGT